MHLRAAPREGRRARGLGKRPGGSRLPPTAKAVPRAGAYLSRQQGSGVCRACAPLAQSCLGSRCAPDGRGCSFVGLDVRRHTMRASPRPRFRGVAGLHDPSPPRPEPSVWQPAARSERPPPDALTSPAGRGRSALARHRRLLATGCSCRGPSLAAGGLPLGYRMAMSATFHAGVRARRQLRVRGIQRRRRAVDVIRRRAGLDQGVDGCGGMVR